ncbi:pyridoxal phosphate-dependent aminotransferase [Gynurincola endophyticus]|uniref:pyridoxal phosphate-dependent aminotransferase n=1 Tax=Gynurincola endophyticus TaxID=2479004 RepID=UPI001F47FFBE|nr:aminotransferase class I/II-fold pyridoxal phosphate-dependent enzyme [Gynurincola endophyticus]
MSMKFSQLAETLIGSEIVKLGADIKEKIRGGEHIYNFTIGDFDPSIFPIPDGLKTAIIEAYQQNFTNYPSAEGNLDLRESISSFLEKNAGVKYGVDEILVASGGRPLIYTLYRAICDPGDEVVYAVPSWNNNHYTHFVGATHVTIETTPETNFMLTAEQIAPYISSATLLALCSPLNPTGTVFNTEELKKICDMVVAENAKRGADRKKLYVMYDQMYWMLTFDGIKHVDPVTLVPEMRNYTIFVDAISKVFAATGVRVGWSTGPKAVLAKMKAILSHVGAWAPMAEQKATAKFLLQQTEIDQYLASFKTKVYARLKGIYEGFQQLKAEGFAVDAIAPQAAIYLTLQFNLAGKTTADGKLLAKQSDVTGYLLDKAKLAIVPFSAFGASADSNWYRLSIGTCKLEEIPAMIEQLRKALIELK